MDPRGPLKLCLSHRAAHSVTRPSDDQPALSLSPGHTARRCDDWPSVRLCPLLYNPLFPSFKFFVPNLNKIIHLTTHYGLWLSDGLFAFSDSLDLPKTMKRGKYPRMLWTMENNMAPPFPVIRHFCFSTCTIFFPTLGLPGNHWSDHYSYIHRESHFLKYCLDEIMVFSVLSLNSFTYDNKVEILPGSQHPIF